MMAFQEGIGIYFRVRALGVCVCVRLCVFNTIWRLCNMQLTVVNSFVSVNGCMHGSIICGLDRGPRSTHHWIPFASH